MKTFLRFSLFVFIIGFMMSNTLIAQNTLKVLSKEGGVVLSYKWKTLPDKKNKGLELCMELNNTNEFPTEVEFTFEIIRNKESKSKSPEIKKCIKPKKTIKGRKKDMNFMIADVTMADVKSENFELKINDFEVKQVTKCK